MMIDMDEEQFKQEIKIQEEEERPTVGEPSSNPDLKALLKDEIRLAIKEMLMEGDSLTPTKEKSQEQPRERKSLHNPFSNKRTNDNFDKDSFNIPTEPPPMDAVGGNPDAAKPPGDSPTDIPVDSHDPDKEPNEWSKYEKHQYQMSEYLENEWDHKSWMLTTKFYDREIIQLHELVLKELSLSNLPDTELAFIYAVKMDCIEEWLSMGFTELAKQRLVHMLFRLRLLTSVDAVELVGQHGTSTMSMSMDRETAQREGMQEEEQNKPKFGLSAIRKRLGSITK